MKKTAAKAPYWFFVMLLLVVPVVAQEDAVEGTEAESVELDPMGAEVDGEGDDAALEQIEELLEGDEEFLAGGGYSYDPAGRRDPFLSLLRRTQLRELPDQRPEGVPGLLIDEVDIKGIFQLEGRWFAQVQTADKEKSYLIEGGDHLYDGEVVSITTNEIIFKQIVNDPSIIKPFREVVKKLNPEP